MYSAAGAVGPYCDPRCARNPAALHLRLGKRVYLEQETCDSGKTPISNRRALLSCNYLKCPGDRPINAQVYLGRINGIPTGVLTEAETRDNRNQYYRR